MCWHAIILAKTYWHLMEIKRYLTRFFILFFKMKDLELKICQNTPQILNLLSISIQRLIWIVSKFELSLVKIGQNVTSLFVTTCHYQLFATTFGHFCNYFLCWSYLQLDYNQFMTILMFILTCEQHLVWFSSKKNNLCPINCKCDQFSCNPMNIQRCIL